MSTSKTLERLNTIANHLEPTAKKDKALEKSEWKDIIHEIRRRQRQNRTANANDRGYIRQKTTGKLWVRERIDRLVDQNSFYELGSVAGRTKYAKQDTDEKDEYTPANFIAGKAKMNQRPIIVAADDFTIRGGHADGAVWGKSLYAEQLARSLKIPMVRLIDGSSGGGSVTLALDKGSTMLPPLIGMHDMIASLSEIPVVAAALGPAVGLGAARATLTHFSVIPQNIGSLFAAGPPIVANATFETVTKESLGGALIHTANGSIDNLAVDEDDCFAQVRQFLSYLPANTHQLPSRINNENDDPNRCDDELISIIPRRRQRSYQVRDILIRVMDQGSWFEIGARWGDGAVCGLARLNGYPVGIISFDGSKQGNVLTTASCQKFRRHIDLCDVFGIPILNFADYAGFSVGTQAEREATIRHGSTLTAALYQCDIPYFTVVLRKVFGVAGAAFVDNRIPNMRVAWPSGDWGSLPLEGGIYAAYKRELDAAGDKKQELYDNIMAKFEAVRSPVRTAEAFDIELIDPRHTRPILCEWVQMIYDHILPVRLEKVKVNGPRVVYRP
ncbi:carboxyl transferase [Halteromyces radiatus]|uniref:carboxyl transferase n=1 Tax=Halteromyces radiatus TaxID=101107 RepID=UPI0022210BF9|nr:carboxyl transferase [Halteromyces radiatus]KAI8086149.1 carboxyl transferase [Halteromyces radiatus]